MLKADSENVEKLHGNGPGNKAIAYIRAKLSAALHTKSALINYQQFLLTMLSLQHTTVICVIAFMLCTVTTTTQGQEKLPIQVSPVTIPSISGECPSDDNRQESRSFLGNVTREIIRNLNTPTSQIRFCGPGEWRRVFYLNTSRSDQIICPDQWSLVTSPVRGCTGASSTCRTAFSDDNFTAYSKVCGRIIGEGRDSPDAFFRSPIIATIEGNYLDGVSVTHGASGSRTHIWSFGAGHIACNSCPCDSSDRDGAYITPTS
jgi:hypothetical protein